MVKTLAITALVALATLTGCGGGSKQPPTTAQSAQGVQIVLEAPVLGTVTTPISIQASATGGNGISGWVVYLDNNAAVTENNSSNSLSASVPVVGGNHTLYVRVWDKSGAFVTSPTLQVQVQGNQATVSSGTPASAQAAPPSTPPPPPGPLPAVPGDAKLWDNIQNLDNWESCSACAGGSATTSNFWTSGGENSPSMSGSSREFFIGGPPWASALWIKKLGPENWAAHFLWDFWVRFDPTSAKTAWTAEYDFWQVINGQEFMIGSHCNFGDGHWDIWDSGNDKWVPTDISCEHFSPTTWHHIQWYFERWGTDRYHYGILIVDGEVHNLNQTFHTNAINWNDNIGVQWQLDQDDSGAPLHEWIDNVKLAIW